jgi:hypothetical protein
MYELVKGMQRRRGSTATNSLREKYARIESPAPAMALTYLNRSSHSSI